MPRPPLPRRICCRFPGRGFRPIGRPACDLAVVTVRQDELEAIRLADREGLYQEAAAERMGVSRQTFARILMRARSAVAECVTEGKVLLVETGPVATASISSDPCPIHSGPRRRGRACRCARGEGAHHARDGSTTGVV